MTAITDSAVFGSVFSTTQMQAIWSDRQRTDYFLRFEAALAKVQARLGIIPQYAADEIVKHCKLEYMNFDELRQKTELIGYPVLPMVQQLVAQVNKVQPGLGEWAHWGTTTQDLTDTAVILQMRDTFQLVETVLDDIIYACEKLCQKHRLTPMAARSNLQQAVPMSFGFKMARLLVTFRRHRQRLKDLLPRLLILQFSGAAGTLATITESTSFEPRAVKDGDEPLALRCQALLADELGLSVPEIAWHTERDNLAEASNFLALLTATCAKFATDLKLMMQTEVAEAREPYVAHRGSSSTMPQKRNPIGSAYICSMAASVRQMSAGMVEAMVADHERSTGPWEIEWILLPQICALSHACLKQTHYLLDGLEVDEQAMKANLDISKGTIVSEAVMMGLGKAMGRQKAHDVVYDLCRKAQVEERSLLELLKGSEDVMKAGVGEEELELLCDPGGYLGLSGVMVDRVLDQRQ